MEVCPAEKWVSRYRTDFSKEKSLVLSKGKREREEEWQVEGEGEKKDKDVSYCLALLY